MYLQLFVIIICIIIIIYLNYKQKIDKNIEHLDFSQGVNREGLTNLLSAYNSVSIKDNNISNNIYGSLKLNGNVKMNRINSNIINVNELNANNITTNEYNIQNIDLNKYKICLQDHSHCIKPYLLNIYSQINSINSPYNNMYLSDASNCLIYEYNLHIHAHNNTESFGLSTEYLKVFGENVNLLTDISLETIKYFKDCCQSPSESQRISFYYFPQHNYDTNYGFKILIPNPTIIGFKCKVVWIEIKNNYIRSFRVTSSYPDISNNVLDVVYSNYKSFSNSLRPDGADYNLIGDKDRNFSKTTQWIPIPINYDLLSSEKAIYIRRNRNDILVNDTLNPTLAITGLAFTTNPWNHCKLPAIAIHWSLNAYGLSPNVDKLSTSTTLIHASQPNKVITPFNACTDYITFDGNLLITRIPVINSGKDKLLYLNIANNTTNINIHDVLIQTDTTILLSSDDISKSNILNSSQFFTNKTITQIETFATTYDNPFARFFNSHKNNRYIATKIPASLIKSNFIGVILQSQLSSGNGLMIREIGTHDLIYT